MTDRTIRIEYPLDLAIAGAVIRAVGAMWPAAMIDTTITDRLVIKVPDAPAAKITKKVLRQMVEDESDPDIRADAERFDGKTLTTTVPKDIARVFAAWAYGFLTSVEGSVNYVEQTATHEETGKQLVVIAAWSKDQTPHELRKQAEAERDRLRGTVQRMIDELRAGDASDGYHTHNDLYEYRLLYNAHAARGWLAAGIPVVKSWNHSDGQPCFGGGWFVVVATLSTGQVSNHYEAYDWDLFDVPEVDQAPEWDGHTPDEAAQRLRAALAGNEGGEQAETCELCAEQPGISGRDDWPLCQGHWNWWLANYLGTHDAPARKAHLITNGGDPR